MVAKRSSEELKRELEAERQRLGEAVGTLRTKAQTVRRRLPLIAFAAGGAGLAARSAGKRVFHGRAAGREKRARFSFLNRD